MLQYCKNIYKAVGKLSEILQEPCNVRSRHYKWNVATIFIFHRSIAVMCGLSSPIVCFLKLIIPKEKFPHSTVILEEYFENISLKSCNIVKIFIKLFERFLKYCRNLAMSVQNIINGKLLQY